MIGEPIKRKLQEVEIVLDPLQLLEEVRAMQSHLVVLADGVGNSMHRLSHRTSPSFWPPCRMPGEPERSARLTAWSQSHAICDRYKALSVMTAALRVE
jgi:hypothetical protein